MPGHFLLAEGGSQLLPDIGVIPQNGMPCSHRPQAQEPLISDLFVWGCASFTLFFSNHLGTESQDKHPLLSPKSFPEYLAPSPPAPNHCSFLPQVYRPRKQPPCSNIPCTCDAGYSPDFTAKYHGSSYDAYMGQRSQVSQLLRKHTSLWGGCAEELPLILTITSCVDF